MRIHKVENRLKRMDTNVKNEQRTILPGSFPMDAAKLKCPGFKALTRWQVERYQQAVSENRWYMSQKHFRWVAWVEAERDFLNQGYYGCAGKWRQEYCGEICPYKENCLLAIRLVNESKGVPLPKAG